MLRRLLAAAQFLHGRGIVHRDIKVRTRACARSDRCGYQAGSAPASRDEPLLYFGNVSFLPAQLLNFVRRPELQVPRCNRLGVVASGAPNCTDAYVARVATFVVTSVCLSFSGCTENGTRVFLPENGVFFDQQRSIGFLCATRFWRGLSPPEGSPSPMFCCAVSCASVGWACSECAASAFAPACSLEPAVAHTTFYRRATCSKHGEPTLCWCVSAKLGAVLAALF